MLSVNRKFPTKTECMIKPLKTCKTKHNSEQTGGRINRIKRYKVYKIINPPYFHKS